MLNSFHYEKNVMLSRRLDWYSFENLYGINDDKILLSDVAAVKDKATARAIVAPPSCDVIGIAEKVLGDHLGC